MEDGAAVGDDFFFTALDKEDKAVRVEIADFVTVKAAAILDPPFYQKGLCIFKGLCYQNHLVTGLQKGVSAGCNAVSVANYQGNKHVARQAQFLYVLAIPLAARGNGDAAKLHLRPF